MSSFSSMSFSALALLLALCAASSASASIFDSIKSKVDEVQSTIADKVDSAKSAVADQVDSAKKAIADNAGTVKDAVSDQVDWAKKAIADNADTVKDAVADQVDSAKKTIADNAETVKNAVADKVDSIKNVLSAKCPPSGFDSVANFSLTAYAAAPWYPQKQIPLIYQTKKDLYCVQAQYKAIKVNDPSAGMHVYNYANSGGVNGSSKGSSPGSSNQMVAMPDPSGSASKLLVGPKALTRAKFLSFAYGPYWVVAVGPSANATLAYDWAVVSGGAPTYGTPTSGCSTLRPAFPSTWQYKGGLWLFTRKPTDTVAAAAAEAAAAALGLDTKSLVAVQQAGCIYPASYN